jgi:enoyl-CoA hydratase/carnithine racemase
MILTCRRYSATELLSLNLLSRVVAKEALASAVAAVAHELIKKKPDAVAASKATVNALSRSRKVLRPDLLLARE